MQKKGISKQNLSLTRWGENKGVLILMAVFQDFILEAPLTILINETHL